MQTNGWKDGAFCETIFVTDEAQLRALRVIKKRIEKTAANDLSKLKGEPVSVSVSLELSKD